MNKTQLHEKIVLIALGLALTLPQAHASFVLILTGTPGSGVVSYDASGSMTVDVASVDGLNSGTGRLPLVNGGDWTSGWSRNVGNALSDYPADLHDDLGLSDGGISIAVNASPIGVWDTFDFDPSATSGGDDFRPDPSATISYPTVTAGAVVSWSGSGTFTLDSSDPAFDTFEEVFTVGNYGQTINSTDDYIINIVSVPEPSSLPILTIGFLTMLGHRRR